jgi:hypothetical protein
MLGWQTRSFAAKLSRRLLESTESVSFLGGSGGYGCSERRWYGQLVGHWTRSQKFPYERQTHWKSNALRLPSTTGAKETAQER